MIMAPALPSSRFPKSQSAENNIVRNAILACCELFRFCADCWNAATFLVKDRKIWRNYSLLVVHIEIPSSPGQFDTNLSGGNAISRGNCQFQMHMLFCCQSQVLYYNEEGRASVSLLPHCRACFIQLLSQKMAVFRSIITVPGQLWFIVSMLLFNWIKGRLLWPS